MPINNVVIDPIDDIKDEQERLFSELNLIKDAQTTNRKKRLMQLKEDLKFRKVIKEFRILRNTLIFISFLGIMILFILITTGVHFLVIFIDLVIICSYYIYFRYLKYNFKNILKISKKEFYFIIKNSEKFQRDCLIFDIFIASLSFLLLIILWLETKEFIFSLVLINSIIFLYLTD